MKNHSAGPDDNGVVRYRLKNGAILLVKEDHSNPVVSLNLWVEAGSIDEKKDERGMAHLIEHMIFKGTVKRGVGEISRQVEAAGGYLNAFTSFEHTCFYVVLPSSQIEKALDVEFDAFMNSVFDAGELKKEKEVVFEEMRMRRDDPWSWSWELLFSILYQKNPYHWPVIGDMDVLREVPRERLLKYYKTHYVPSNMVISIVGDVSAAKVHQWIDRHFSNFKAPKAPERRFTFDAEPKKLQCRAEAGDVQQIYLSLGFPIVPLDHPDSPVLELLDAVLGEGHSSRLNLSIREEQQLADEIGTEFFTGKYGGAFLFQALTDLKRVDELVVQMMREVRKLIDTGVSEKELSRIKTKIKASKIYEKQSVDGQAKTVGFWELQGGFELEQKFLDRLDAVRSADVRRVAEKYLKPSRGSMILYHPKDQKIKTSASYWQKQLEAGLKNELVNMLKGRPSKEKVIRLRLKNGSTLLVKERKGLPLVSLGLFVGGGFVDEPVKKQGITLLLTKCLSKGTWKRNYKDFSQEVEGLASHLDTLMEKDYWGITLDTLKTNFDPSLNLLLEAALEPRLADAEIEKEKKTQIAAIERLKDDPSEFSMLHSDRLTFKNTPYAHLPMGTVESIAGLTPAQIRDWHKTRFSKKNMTWIAVGDISPQELKETLDAKLEAPVIEDHFKPAQKTIGYLEADQFELATQNQQASLVLGYRAPAFHSKDYYGFRLMNTILNGMGGRLFVELREKKSLAYSVYATYDSAEKAGVYQIYIGCAPAKVNDAKEGLMTVLRSMIDKPVSPEELARAKSYLVGLFQVGQQSNRAQVQAIARHEMIGDGPTVLDQYPKLIQAITAADIQRLAKSYLMTEKFTTVLLSSEVKS